MKLSEKVGWTSRQFSVLIDCGNADFQAMPGTSIWLRNTSCLQSCRYKRSGSLWRSQLQLLACTPHLGSIRLQVIISFCVWVYTHQSYIEVVRQTNLQPPPQHKTSQKDFLVLFTGWEQVILPSLPCTQMRMSMTQVSAWVRIAGSNMILCCVKMIVLRSTTALGWQAPQSSRLIHSHIDNSWTACHRPRPSYAI